MTDKLREAAQMALDALEQITGKAEAMSYYCSFAVEIESLRAALAQPEQEPVAWCFKESTGNLFGFTTELFDDEEQASNLVPLYTAPPQREWQGLTDEDIRKLSDDCAGVRDENEFIRAIEAKLREKNT